MRGYSIVVLCTIVSSLFILRMRRTDHPALGDKVGYVAFAAAGIATHVFMMPVVVLQAGFVFAARRVTRRWLTLFVLACVLGVVPYVVGREDMLTGGTGRQFWLGFPLRLSYELFGGATNPPIRTTSLVAVILTAALLVVAAFTIGWRREWLFVGGPAVALILFWWLIAQSVGLGTRYFIWALPAVAVACVFAARRHPALLVVIVVIVVLQIWSQASRWNTPDLASKAAGVVVQHQHNLGNTVCEVGYGDGPLTAYTTPGSFLRIPNTDIAALSQCDVIVMVTRMDVPESMLDAIAERFPYTLILPAYEPTVISSKTPIAR